ncbi:unnamed protein product, partial [Didymodactylos carnosus]
MDKLLKVESEAKLPSYAQGTIDYTINDPRGQKLEESKVRLNDNSAFDIKFKLPDNVNLDKRLLRFNGYEYVTEKKSGEKTYWKCKDYWSKKCNVRIHTLNIDDSIVHQPKFDHDHPADAAKSEVRDLMNNLTDRAKTTNETTNDILSTFMT